MFNSKAIIALLFSITAVITSCSNDKHDDTNADAQNSADITANVPHDSLVNTSAPANTDFLLRPGDAAGRIKIDGNSEDVMKTLGKPDSSDAAMQKMVAFWFDEQDGLRYSTSIFAARSTEDMSPAKVRQIRVTSPAFKTQDSLGVTSTLDDIKKAYNVHEIKYPVSPNKELHIWSTNKGIAFEIGGDQRCTAVIIYKKGDELSPTYLPLRVIGAVNKE